MIIRRGGLVRVVRGGSFVKRDQRALTQESKRTSETEGRESRLRYMLEIETLFLRREPTMK
jgi:hypothetical protein